MLEKRKRTATCARVAVAADFEPWLEEAAADGHGTACSLVTKPGYPAGKA